MNYDITVIGSCTAGLYFAARMAKQGYKVLVVDKLKEEELGKRLDIFHLDETSFDIYGTPKPNPGDEDYVHQFDYSASRSALGNWEKHHEHTVYVMKLPLYIKRMIAWAKEIGVDFMFETSFEDFIYHENGRINGAKLVTADGKLTVHSRLVADCSGTASAARRKLPESYECENFEITDKDKFYVAIKYIHFNNPRPRVQHTISWPYYKVWIAPCEDEHGAILGVGANISFEYGEKCLSKFLENINIPDYEVVREEKGITPYRRPPYSFVADGFVALGDSACLTKPSNGEGITAQWFLVNIAAEEIGKAMADGKYPYAKDIWQINVRYQKSQGAEFAELLATLTGAVDCSRQENDYEFKHNIIFKDNLKNSVPDKSKEKRQLIAGLLKGLACGKIRPKTIKKLIHYSGIAGNIKHHYLDFPENINGFEQWKQRADELWLQAGSMSDVVYDKGYYLNNLD